MKIATPIIALFLGVPGLALAQSEIRIPTDAEQVGAARAYAARSEAAHRCVPQRPHRDRHRPLRSSGAHDGRSSSSATEEGTSPILMVFDFLRHSDLHAFVSCANGSCSVVTCAARRSLLRPFDDLGKRKAEWEREIEAPAVGK